MNLLGYFAPVKERSNRVKEEGSTYIREEPDQIDERGEIFLDHMIANPNPIQLTIGDDRLPLGLWKSIEQMRKNELARVMIKPKYGYDCEKNRDTVFFPRGW